MIARSLILQNNQIYQNKAAIVYVIIYIYIYIYIVFCIMTHFPVFFLFQLAKPHPSTAPSPAHAPSVSK